MKAIPGLSDLQERVYKDLGSKLSLSDTNMKSVASALSAVLAGEFKLAYLLLQDIQKNIYPDTADPSVDGGELNHIGQIQLNRQPKPATSGVYRVAVNAISGSSLKSGLTFKSNAESNAPGYLFVLDNDVILTGSSDEIQIRALNAGPDYLLNVDDTLTATEPLPGVDQVVVVNSVVEQPISAESISRYRQSILDSIRLEPQGGSRTDYRLWADDAQGVSKVYPYVKNGEAGTVMVFVEATEADSIDGMGTPSQNLLDSVAAVINFDPDETIPLKQRGRIPLGVSLEVVPVEIRPVDITVLGLQVDTEKIRESISANLKDFLSMVRPFIAGADLFRDKNDVLTAVKAQAVVNDTIGNANTFIDFRLFVDGVELNSHTFSGGNIPYLRNLEFI